MEGGVDHLYWELLKNLKIKFYLEFENQVLIRLGHKGRVCLCPTLLEGCCRGRIYKVVPGVSACQRSAVLLERDRARRNHHVLLEILWIGVFGLVLSCYNNTS